MAKATKAANDVSAEFISTLTELQKVSARADFSKMQTRTGTLARGVDICGIYAKVKPFLEIIVRIPFIPGKAKDAVKLLMSALDAMCPR